MSRPLDRRQAVLALLRGSTALAGASWLAGCAANGVAGPGATGAIGTSAVERASLPAIETRNTAKVALLLPLSGGAQTALVAKGMQQAAELALFDRQSVELQLIVKDDKGTEAGARAAAEDAIKAGAELIIGPLTAKSVAAAAPVARSAGVAMIAFSNDPAVAGPGVHLIGFAVENEVARVVSYAAAQGRRRMAALIPDDADGRLIEAAFRAAVERSGAGLAPIERYPTESNGLVDAAKRIRDAIKAAEQDGEPIEALFLPGVQDTLPQLASLISQLGIDTTKVKLLGTSGWDHPNVNRQGRLTGAWFAAPDPRGWAEFSQRFGKTYGALPPRLASLAHDAVLVAAALAGEPKGTRFTPANLTRATGFTGVDGAFRLSASGIAERSLGVLELQRQGPTVVDAAPAAPTAAEAAIRPGPRT